MRVRTLGGFEAYIKLKIENVITQNRLKYNNEKPCLMMSHMNFHLITNNLTVFSYILTLILLAIIIMNIGPRVISCVTYIFEA